MPARQPLREYRSQNNCTHNPESRHLEYGLLHSSAASAAVVRAVRQCPVDDNGLGTVDIANVNQCRILIRGTAVP